MNLIQSLRRLSQQAKGWDKSLSSQEHQLRLIKKLYADNDLELYLTSSACPEQYDIKMDGNLVAYYRLRHGEFYVDYPKCGGERIYEASPNGDGIFDDDERLFYLTKALRSLQAKIESDLLTKSNATKDTEQDSEQLRAKS